ncbi:hypothetical protein [Eubacterium barkeri]|uniref:Uncharacterized protein n=1 Tax=Eubacterium barkeri TaxID=1528 RepID=A0A1H3CFF7_EUBBA|nr:hypothetical protein [Eubacterium barkeri]SDX52638.1 hypothetical protein SAMN04488579_10378 [Eubacterium barkeri]
MKKNSRIILGVLILVLVIILIGLWSILKQKNPESSVKETVITPSVSVTPKPTIPVQAAEGLTKEETEKMKMMAMELYQAAFNSDYDKVKSLSTRGFSTDLQTCLDTQESLIMSDGTNLIKNLREYTDVSTPVEVGEPTAYGGDSEFIVTLLLQGDYTARVGFVREEDGQFLVNTYAMQSLARGEGGVMGHGAD